jgi:curved DNA-binding protein CbpA
MKKITDSRKLLGSAPNATLKDLNTLYKGLMKTHHPDRFQEEAQRLEAEQTSQRVIEAFKFLESIHPETHEKEAEEYTKTTETTALSNWNYKHMTLHVNFGDGSVYEYFGVPPNVYKKFVNTDGNARFARRHIFHAFPYRKISGPKEAAQ